VVLFFTDPIPMFPVIGGSLAGVNWDQNPIDDTASGTVKNGT
jgi:hypothetical protein